MERIEDCWRRALGTPTRVVVVVGLFLSVAAGTVGGAGGMAYARTGAGGGADRRREALAPGTRRGRIIEKSERQPTTLVMKLRSGGTVGADVRVQDQGTVNAVAALEGADANMARGTISWSIYSDSGCTDQVAWVRPRRLRGGKESGVVRLPPGTYYWRAVYSGDAANSPSTSACGSSVEIVEAATRKHLCKTLAGVVNVNVPGGHLVLSDALSTDRAKPEKLTLGWKRGHHLRLTHVLDATCTVRGGQRIFQALGGARVDGRSGYWVRLEVRLVENGARLLRLLIRNKRGDLVTSVWVDPGAGAEVIS
ncbi:MAG TPA: Ig-like domain-containing protein [Solirubrobacteraceae bacterium]|jgi:hypothetical protein|nr:Ig-like domain-containing protein [Solirubrobacteraceae bacterium]